MTAYFDQKASELRGELSPEQIDAFEETLLADMVLVCEAFRGEQGHEFPPHLRTQVYQAMRQHLTVAWCSAERYAGPDYEDDAAHVQGLRDLVETLHDGFHAAGRAGWKGGDSPGWPRVEMRDRFLDAVGVPS